jgi:hypothetical protein
MPAPGVAVRFERERPSPALVSVDGRTYPLRSAQIRARAEGGLASSTLNQVFANPYDEPLEVVYTLPLPADGAVIGYTIRIGERVIRGEVEPREKAEAAYRQALYEGRTAGLLEEDRDARCGAAQRSAQKGASAAFESGVRSPFPACPTDGRPRRKRTGRIETLDLATNNLVKSIRESGPEKTRH